MFDQLKGMASMAGVLKDLPRIKAKMEEVKEQLALVRVDAETGGGAVRAIIDGQLRVVKLHVDPALLAGLVEPGNPDDQAMAQELIVGAVNAGLAKAREAAEARLHEAASDLGLPIPSGGLEGLLS